MFWYWRQLYIETIDNNVVIVVVDLMMIMIKMITIFFTNNNQKKKYRNQINLLDCILLFLFLSFIPIDCWYFYPKKYIDKTITKLFYIDIWDVHLCFKHQSIILSSKSKKIRDERKFFHRLFVSIVVFYLKENGNIHITVFE